MDTGRPPARRVVTVAVPGTASDELTVPRALADRLRTVVRRGYDVIILDVSQLAHCDSMTLGAIVQTYVSAVKAGGTLKLLHVRKRFRDLLATAKLDRVIELIESADDEPGDFEDPDATEMRTRDRT